MTGGAGPNASTALLWPKSHPTDTAVSIPSAVMLNRQPVPGLWQLRLEVPLPWGPPEPGQFVQLACGRGPWRLRRPFSLAAWSESGNAGRMEIVYAPVGRETTRMTGLTEGETVEVAGPFGVGFGVDSGKRAVLVGGGRGAAPLLFLADRLRHHGHPAVLVYGYRSHDLRWPVESQVPLAEASEDGSRGHHGTVLSLMGEMAASGDLHPGRDALYACGPTPMLRAVAAWAAERGFALETSLETYFGCGYGVCAACAVPIRGGSGYDAYAFACREGPVFRSSEVLWDAFVD